MILQGLIGFIKLSLMGNAKNGQTILKDGHFDHYLSAINFRLFV